MWKLSSCAYSVNTTALVKEDSALKNKLVLYVYIIQKSSISMTWKAWWSNLNKHISYSMEMS
jgi:hypothetical protein